MLNAECRMQNVKYSVVSICLATRHAEGSEASPIDDNQILPSGASAFALQETLCSVSLRRSAAVRHAKDW